MPDAFIPALAADGLDRVPGYVIDPTTGEEDPEWRTRHFAWHEKVRDWRPWAHHKIATDSEFLEAAFHFCSQDPAFFSLLFLDVEEPRAMAYFDQTGVTLQSALAGLRDGSVGELSLDDLSYRTIHPFLPFAYQVEAMRLTTYVILGPLRSFYHDILWDKARGVGMSYAFLAWAYWAWIFIKGLRGTILTENWNKAERTKDVNSLFGKLDLFFDKTPDLLIPEGFKSQGEKGAHRLTGRLINPKTGAAIFTETTTKDSTRSGREAYVAVDEMNFHEYLDEEWATIGGTTKHRIGWSSASRRYGRQGERKLKAGRENPDSCTVRVVDWYDNPHQDHLWFAQERARFKAAGQEEQFEVEYLRNPTAGAGRLVYVQQLELTSWTDQGYDPTKMLKVSVDPGISDFTAFVFWQTHQVEGKKRIRWIDACQLARVPVQFWAHVMTGLPPEPAKDGAEPDEMYRYLAEGFFDQGNIRAIMQFMRSVAPRSIMLYGDPAMNARSVTHESWIGVFTRETLRLREAAYGVGHPDAIPIVCNLPWDVLAKRNNYHDRRVGFREALMMSEFYAGAPGVHDFYEAIRDTMFQKVTEQSTKAPGHIHTDDYHVVSAGEFGMVWETLHLTPEELQPIQLPRERERGRTAGLRARSRQSAGFRESLVSLG